MPSMRRRALRYVCAWKGHEEYVTLGGAVLCERCTEYLTDPSRPGHKPREARLPGWAFFLRGSLIRTRWWAA